jgi:hypothetical protein
MSAAGVARLVLDEAATAAKVESLVAALRDGAGDAEAQATSAFELVRVVLADPDIKRVRAAVAVAATAGRWMLWWLRCAAGQGTPARSTLAASCSPCCASIARRAHHAASHLGRSACWLRRCVRSG